MLLDDLYRHELKYYAFSSQHETTPCAWYLSCSDLPQSREVNRAFRLRDDGRGPDAVAREVISHFRAYGARVTAEIDSVSEAQGIGFALRRLGITPVLHTRSLMMLAAPPASVDLPQSIQIVEIDRRDGNQLLESWMETNLHDVEIYENASMWRTLAEREARSNVVRLYLALWDGQPAATCCLFQAEGMGRIEMVETRTEYRRRGLASAAVSRAAYDSASAGDSVTYLFTDTGSGAERLYTKLGFAIDGIDVMHRHIEV
jgi:GNAT superfamily N-acetyltransferase